jgi:hypothetical protein
MCDTLSTPHTSGHLGRASWHRFPWREGNLAMGKFIYENSVKVDIEDRALTHIQLVMTAKLRRGEPFGVTWKDDVSMGGGRTTVWIHAGSSLVYKYHGSRQPSVNRAWIEALAFTANAPSGLYLVPEPAEQQLPDGSESSLTRS